MIKVKEKLRLITITIDEALVKTCKKHKVMNKQFHKRQIRLTEGQQNRTSPSKVNKRKFKESKPKISGYLLISIWVLHKLYLRKSDLRSIDCQNIEHLQSKESE